MHTRSDDIRIIDPANLTAETRPYWEALLEKKNANLQKKKVELQKEKDELEEKIAGNQDWVILADNEENRNKYPEEMVKTTLLKGTKLSNGEILKQNVTIMLERTVFHRAKEIHPLSLETLAEERIVVVGDPLSEKTETGEQVEAKGATGKLFNVIEEHKVENGQWVVTPANDYVAKLIIDSSGNLKKDALNEQRFGARLLYLGTKPITSIYVDDRKFHFYFIMMKKVEGETLESFLKKQQQKNAQTQLTITINTLRAVKEFHDRGMVHGDLKPANSMIDPKTLKIEIIDTGTVIEESQIDKNETKILGSVPYLPYDVEEDNPNKDAAVQDKKADIYVAGLMVARVWGAAERGTSESGVTLTKSRTNSPNRQAAFKFKMEFKRKDDETSDANGSYEPFLGLKESFEEITNLTEENKNAILRLCQQLTHHDKAQRLSLESAIDQFENMRLQLILSDPIYANNENKKINLELANRAGRRARDELYELAVNIREKKFEDVSSKSSLLGDTSSESSSSDDTSLEHFEENDEWLKLKKLKLIIFDGLSKFEEKNVYILPEYLSRLDITVLQKCKTKEEVKEQVESIISSFESYANTHLRLVKDFESKGEEVNLKLKLLKKFGGRKFDESLKKYYLDISRDFVSLYKKDEKREVKLDDLDSLNQNFAEKIPVIKEKLLTFNSLLAQYENTHRWLEKAFFYQQKELLSEPKVTGDGESTLKARIEQAMGQYVQATFNKKNIRKKDKAASDRRFADIKAMLEILEESKDENEINVKIEAHLKKMKTGWGIFSLGRSELREMIKESMKPLVVNSFPSKKNK